MKKLFDPEECDRQIIQDHLRFLQAKKQVEDFNNQKRVLEQLHNSNYEPKLLLHQDPVIRNGFAAYIQSQAIPERDKACIVEKIIKKYQVENNSVKRKRDQPEDRSVEADLTQMDIEEDDKQLYNDNFVNNNITVDIDGFVPNKRRKLVHTTDDVNNTNGFVNNDNVLTLNHAHSNLTVVTQRKRKASEMEIEDEVEIKRRRIDWISCKINVTKLKIIWTKPFIYITKF